MLQLNPHQFASIFESLRIAGTNDRSDKRHSTRMHVQAKVNVATLSDDKIVRCFSGLTRDLSACGVGLFLSAPIEHDGRFLVCFPDGKHELVVTCIARFCRTLADGLFGIGAEFDSIGDAGFSQQLKQTDDASADRIRKSILG